jgi:hypothetical protein
MGRSRARTEILARFPAALLPTNGRPRHLILPEPGHKSRSDRLNRGPHQQVFVCGVVERREPVRQDRFSFELALAKTNLAFTPTPRDTVSRWN